MFWLIGLGIVAILAIAALIWVAGARRPEGSDGLHTLDQVMAQTRAFTGQGHQPDEPSWDGQERTPVSTHPGF